MATQKLNKLVKIAVSALEDIKARDIVVLDVQKLTTLYDTLVIASADSARQTKALAAHLREDIKAAGGHIIGSEGEASGEWVLVDCADFVVHIMQPSARAHYNLEELWTPPEPVRVAKVAAPSKPAATPKKSTAAAKAAPKKRAAAPTAAKPVAKKAAVKKAAVKAPAAKTPSVKKPAVKKTAVKKTATKTPVVATTAVKNAVAKTVAAVKKAAAKAAPAPKAAAPVPRRRLKSS